MLLYIFINEGANIFLPISLKEAKALGWDELDIILITGDSYIDHPSNGVSLIGKYLVKKGFKVGVIAEPDISSSDDIMRLGEPKLFWGVTAGLLDSMVANYTSSGKRRNSSDMSAGGINSKLPDRATIVYTNLIRKYFNERKQFIAVGGIEASLRRVSHYDERTDKIRKPILFDSKADAVIFGNGERATVELAEALRDSREWRNIDGVGYIEKRGFNIDEADILLPSFEEVEGDKAKFLTMFKLFTDNSLAVSGKRIVQPVLDRFMVINKPSVIDSDILDEVNELEYERLPHPSYNEKIPAFETIQFSVNSHRGCFGDCAFCAIRYHQGRNIVSRSEASILRELKSITKHKDFKGRISDIGGATANMYMITCDKMEKLGACKDKRCLYPKVCGSLKLSHKPLIELLKRASQIDGIKSIVAGSGVRYDMVLADSRYGREYLELLIDKFISGQLKLAPETFSNSVLKSMKKPTTDDFRNFVELFDKINYERGKKQFISCYFMVAHPCENNLTIDECREKIDEILKFKPEQVQIFTPTPSTWATTYYHTELDEDGSKLHIVKDIKTKTAMKERLMGTSSRGYDKRRR